MSVAKPTNPVKNAVDAAVEYWTSELRVEAKRPAFRDALRTVLERAYKPGERLRLNVDYDPQGELLEAVRAAGIECRGCMFSADGLFWAKTRTSIEPDGRFVVREGYGAPERVVFQPEGVQS